ncbi:MAG: M16 family metallopeptidase [Planctomycetota bacterium]
MNRPNPGGPRASSLVLPLLLLLAVAAPAGAADELPSHPDEIDYGELAFEPPVAADYRHVLSPGAVLYLLPDTALPLIDVAFSFSGGSYLDPVGKEGLAALTGAMMRRGGTTSLSPEAFDQKADFLAAEISAGMGDDAAQAGLNSITANFDDAFSLFMDMVRNPGYDAARFETLKAEVIEGMKQRNDNADGILRSEWSRLMYGESHFEARQGTLASIESIGLDDMRAFHGRIFQPGNLVVGITGDFEPEAMIARLESAFAGWEAGERAPTPPAPDHDFTPGVYFVEKEIPQGKVAIGMRGLTRDHPDSTTLRVMNLILGGGGFTSRITNKVRTEEGLAYSAGSMMRPSYHYPGEFQAFFQSKSSTCALATKLILDEIDRIRAEPVSAEELDVAKASVIETFPRAFESKKAVRDLFVSEEWRPHVEGFFEGYRDRVRAITVEDIQRVAREHLDPAEMMIVLVGDWSEISPGDLDGRAKMADFFDGEATELPLRDPLTLEPIGP